MTITKVIYTGASQDQINWGGCDDPRKSLSIGKLYNVEKTEEHSWHTKIKIVGVDGLFNSVSFDEVSHDPGI